MSRNDKPSGKGKIKFRFIDFEMDGGDATLQDAIREITRAIGRPQVIKLPAALPGANGNGQQARIPDGADDEEQDVEELVADEGDDADEEEASGRVSKPRRFKSPKILNVELKGDNPLRPFLESLAVDSDNKRYMAIAYWFKTYRETPEVTPDHIYTAYKAMSWTDLPRDAGAPLRALKKDGSCEKGSGKQAYILNHIGEGKVEKMINKAQPAQ
jgi:hypothetical protein